MGTARPSLGQLYPLNLRGGACRVEGKAKGKQQGWKRSRRSPVLQVAEHGKVLQQPKAPRQGTEGSPVQGWDPWKGTEWICAGRLWVLHSFAPSLNSPGAQCGFTPPPAHQSLSSESPGSVALTRKYFSKRTLEVLKVPKVSMSITVLKALKDRALAGHRKFPAAPEPQGQAGQGWDRCQGPSVAGRVRDNVLESTWRQPC